MSKLSERRLEDYSDWLSKYTETMTALQEINTSDLTPEELGYYTEVMTRINKKLAESGV